MAARRRKDSTRAQTLRKRKAAALKGWETRRAREKERVAKLATQARKRAETRRRNEEARERRRAAARKGAAKHKARVRATGALDTLVKQVDLWREVGRLKPLGKRWHQRERELDVLRGTWHRAKREVYDASDSYEDYLDILERVAEDSGTEWDIAYGPDGEAAA